MPQSGGNGKVPGECSEVRNKVTRGFFTKLKTKNMVTTYKTVTELIETGERCPLPLETMPNSMGINLCSVEAISWQKQDDGQLVSLTIYFLPNQNGDPRDKM